VPGNRQRGINMKCAVCKNAERDWTWQPFGPGSHPLDFTVPGSHYRGFPAIPVCQFCKQERIEAGETVTFVYKRQGWVYKVEMSCPTLTK
jgi:hypothetical protein